VRAEVQQRQELQRRAEVRLEHVPVPPQQQQSAPPELDHRRGLRVVKLAA